MSQVSAAELDAYVDLLRREDGGAAFLQIMREFRTYRGQERHLLRRGRYPVQIVCGERDRALKLGVRDGAARRAAGLDTLHRLPGAHFPQEDQAAAIADRIAAFVEGS